MAKRPFVKVRSPFGAGADERATQEAFVEYVGGTARADRLMSIYNNSWPSEGAFGKRYSKAENFRAAARREGFSDLEIDAFLSL